MTSHPSSDIQFDVLAVGSAMVEITPTQMGRSLADVETMIPLPSGSAANFASALASLDVKVALMSRIGADELGRWLIDRLSNRGIATDFIMPVEGQLTPVSFAWMDREGEKTFYFYRFQDCSDPMRTLTPEQIDAAVVSSARLFDFTEAAVRNEPLRSAALRAARLAREAGREVCYAVNYRPSAWLDQTEEQIISAQRQACSTADIVVMNHDEATVITGSAGREEGADRIAALGSRIVVVTAGENGATLLAEGDVTHIPAREVDVVYDIGAGDTFHAGLLAAHLAGMPPVEAARFASDAAALRIGRSATAPSPTFDEVANWGHSAS